MKARYIILIYYGKDYLNTNAVQRTSFASTCGEAINLAQRISLTCNQYVQVWDIVADKVVWEP